MVDLILPLGSAAAVLEVAGGKGASLARLVAAGLPVPDGFVVTTDAYREFVADGLSDELRLALLETPVKAAALIAAAFARHPVPVEIAEAVRAVLPTGPVAVRSSATAEDLPSASFAGQHDSYLNVQGVDAVFEAVRRCWASLWTERAITYRARMDIPHQEVSLAVVVQEMVPAEASGVLFTSDPVTGSQDHVVINAAWGLGEAVVSGQVTPDTYVVTRGGSEQSRRVEDKANRVVSIPGGGTRLEPVLEEDQLRPVLDAQQMTQLARLGEQIEDLYGTPVDVEWTLHNNRFAIVQARPITTGEVWNDSLAGNYLWTAGNVGEAVPSVMTPATWSLIGALAPPRVGSHPVSGNIGGRFYLNLSAMTTMADAIGIGGRVRQANELTFGRLPDGIRIPPLPMSRWQVLRAMVTVAKPSLRAAVTLQRRLPEMAARNPGHCRQLRTRITAAETAQQLHSLWLSDVEPLLRQVCPVFDAGARMHGDRKLEADLTRLVGATDARTLLAGMHGHGGDLASLDPLLGLAQAKSGALDPAAFVDRWGHRGPEEFEVSNPRTAEDPAWLDQQLAHSMDPTPLLARQAAARQAAWQRLQSAHPWLAKRLARRLAKAAQRGRAREQARSEFVRAFWVFRAFYLRAGELTGHGHDVFFMTIEELATVLAGVTAPMVTIAARRKAYEHYRSLPPLPTVICGRFDLEAWAADPHRHTDVHDDSAGPRADGELIVGYPGAAGTVEGIARVMTDVAEAENLESGEILVTRMTNVGWTPLFPRAAAVVTDVGAPLSHAAIVARELGIPAVVGCGNASHRITSGDRVRVDGAAGMVVVLSGPAKRPSTDQNG